MYKIELINMLKFKESLMFRVTERTYVRDVCSKKFITFTKDAPFTMAVERMLETNLKEAFVIDGQKLIGMVSLSDVSVIRAEKKDERISITNYMVKDLFTVKQNDTLAHCRDLMMEHNLGRLPVLEDGKLIGVIREQELREYFYMRMEQYGITLMHVIDNIHEAVCVTDKNGVVIFWNKSSEKLYELSRDDIVGSDLVDHFPNAMIADVLKTHQKYQNVYHAPREGSHVVLSAEPVFINDEFVGAVSTDRDITEIKELTTRLEKANETVKYLEKEIQRFSEDAVGNIIGNSEKLRKKVEVVRQVAKTEATILISGESGTGKEVFSRAIHDESERRGMFVPVNCSAIPAGLFESELFGYVEGAFTGARKSGKMGVFEMAKNGTVFLDEIGEMPLHMQAKLLRVLQEREVRRVGGEEDIKINTRVISATNRDLKAMVGEGKFREDLYYRLNVVEIDLPPLRERKGDIPVLIFTFLKEFCDKNNRIIPEIDPDVMMILESYKWEGNIRQLKNTVEYLLVMSHDNRITRDVIPAYIAGEKETTTDFAEYPMDLNDAVRKIEIDNIKKALAMADGKKAKAAKILNIPRTTLYYKIEQYKI